MTLRFHSDFKFDDHSSIIEASPIVIKSGCSCYRVVLRQEGSKYVTHQENVILDGDTWKHGDFYWGHYFEDDRAAAVKDFNARCEKL